MSSSRVALTERVNPGRLHACESARLHVAVVLAFDDHKVVELDVVALDGLAEVRGDLLRRG